MPKLYLLFVLLLLPHLALAQSCETVFRYPQANNVVSFADRLQKKKNVTSTRTQNIAKLYGITEDQQKTYDQLLLVREFLFGNDTEELSFVAKIESGKDYKHLKLQKELYVVNFHETFSMVEDPLEAGLILNFSGPGYLHILGSSFDHEFVVDHSDVVTYEVYVRNNILKLVKRHDWEALPARIPLSRTQWEILKDDHGQIKEIYFEHKSENRNEVVHMLRPN